MALKDTFNTIAEKAGDADKQRAEIARKLETNKADKARAEADKAAALDAKDEAKYKAASRAIADAEAGIEFCEICLRDLQRKQYATEAEDAAIMRGLRAETNAIYVDALLKIEKALAEIVDISETVGRQYDSIDSMARTWKESVMKNFTPQAYGFTADKHLPIAQFGNSAKGKLVTLREGKKADPLFNKGGT